MSSRRGSPSREHEVSVTLIDASPSFTFGFAKLAVMSGDKTADEVRLNYADISKPGVEFRQERVTSIDPAQRRVETDGGAYEADILAIAMGADYDLDATPASPETGRSSTRSPAPSGCAT